MKPFGPQHKHNDTYKGHCGDNPGYFETFHFYYYILMNPCYFYIEVEGDNKIMRVMCTDCHTEFNKGWFWDGGFGHAEDIVCHKCNKVIYAPKKED